MSEGEARERKPSEVLRRGYSEGEIGNLYELGRFLLETGEVRKAEAILTGLNEVAPDFAPAWLARGLVHSYNKAIDNAIFCARQALRVDPGFSEATLFLVSCLLTAGDYHSAGTYLGEIGERIEGGMIENATLIRIFKAQLTRFENR